MNRMFGNKKQQQAQQKTEPDAIDMRLMGVMEDTIYKQFNKHYKKIKVRPWCK